MNEKEIIKNVADKVSVSALMEKPLSEWRQILSKECQVYVFGENYLAKRFDSINYKFCEKDEAKEILIDNLYALLRFKYFPINSDEIEDAISSIVKSFVTNLKTTLIKVSFDEGTDSVKISMLPDCCVAFRNGVYNFKEDKWLFKYEIVEIEELSNRIYLYNPKYVITWYYNFNFEPLPFNINEMELEDFYYLMKELNKTQRNYCFELLHNMSHDFDNKFSMRRFTHLCEILGFNLLQSFSQYFVLLIGSGQNGKNSLFDSCLTKKIIPKPAALALDEIENDQFASGSLVNHSHNVFLETTSKTFVDSTRIKNLTGTPDQFVNSKGVQKYSSYINCKFMFAGNDQDKIKFSDTTTGFRRRINIFEIWYTWDSQKRFLTKGDYYDTSFSNDLHEVDQDITNVIAFIYFAMYGIISGTKNFRRNFEFTFNEWKQRYSDIDVDLKDKIDNITPKKISEYLIKNKTNEETKTLLFDENEERLYNSKTIKELGYYNFDHMIQLLKDEESSLNYFSEHDIYISVRFLQQLSFDISVPVIFTQNIKKIYGVKTLKPLYNNKSYVKCTFVNNKLKIIGD